MCQAPKARTPTERETAKARSSRAPVQILESGMIVFLVFRRKRWGKAPGGNPNLGVWIGRLPVYPDMLEGESTGGNQDLEVWNDRLLKFFR